METNKIYNMDCLEGMKQLPDNSVDSIITDPPYELGFMGKKWDNTGIAYNVDMWKECLRVLKPGGHLLSFGGTRTYHRMTVAIEDAGFEVRDMIEWCYGSGFPKSLNIGKAIDKLQGNEREVVGKILQPGSTNKRIAMGNGRQEEPDLTKGTSEFEGWGTALKPSHEPICMARKPLAEKTVAENCLKWGTGGINIDESRVGIPEGDDSGWSGSKTWNEDSTFTEKGECTSRTKPTGRFPANLIHDNSEEVRECFPESNATNRNNIATRKDDSTSYGGKSGQEFTRKEFGDSGNASRFFKSIIYQAKSSKSERNKGCEELPEQVFSDRNPELDSADMPQNRSGNAKSNFHPTVKPIALMEYLIKMVTPKGGIVLDPFAGSGTTLVSAKMNGFQYIGIEMTEEYIPIIEARLSAIHTTKFNEHLTDFLENPKPKSKEVCLFEDN